MPASNPRITIVVTPRVHAALTKFSAITGKSKSSMVGEILDESVPMFVRMIKVFEAAKLAESGMASSVVDPFLKAQTHLEKQLNLAMDGVDLVAADLLSDMEAIGRRKRRADSGSPRSVARRLPASPVVASPLSNRGGRLPPAIDRQRPKSLKQRGKVKK